jgi:hypothetical protein
MSFWKKLFERRHSKHILINVLILIGFTAAFMFLRETTALSSNVNDALFGIVELGFLSYLWYTIWREKFQCPWCIILLMFVLIGTSLFLYQVALGE